MQNYIIISIKIIAQKIMDKDIIAQKIMDKEVVDNNLNKIIKSTQNIKLDDKKEMVKKVLIVNLDNFFHAKMILSIIDYNYSKKKIYM
jgi:hypothetical protein